MAYLPCLNPNCHSHGKPHPNCRCYSGGEEYAEGGSICDRRMAHEMGCKYYKDGGDINHSADFGAAMHATGGIMNAHKGKSPEKHARNISSGHDKIASHIEDLFKSGSSAPPEPDKAANDKLDSQVADGSLQLPPEGDLGNIDQNQAAMMGMTRGRVANYLQALKPNPAGSPHLAFDEPADDPNKQRIYQSALHVANDPSSVLSHIKAGTLEPEHTQHLGAMYPDTMSLYQRKATDRITQAQMDGEMPDSHVRAGLGQLVGAPLSGEMTPASIQAAQAVFAAPVPQQAQSPGGKGSGKQSASKKALTNSDKAYLTDDQARQERGQKV
jgi:hypothetical protein